MKPTPEQIAIGRRMIDLDAPPDIESLTRNKVTTIIKEVHMLTPEEQAVIEAAREGVK